MGRASRIGREVAAWARQGQLLLTPRRRERRTAPGERAVVFVHGFGAGGAVFEPLRRHVEKTLRLPTVNFSYPSSRSFQRVARSLQDHVAPLVREGRELDLVGHSLGGLLARWYVQELDGAAHVGRLITLATPHAGTRSARLAPGPLRRPLLPDSEVVKRLRAGRARADSVAHTALVAGADLMVSPAASAAALGGADVRWFEDLGHNAMLFEPSVHEAVISALASASASPT